MFEREIKFIYDFNLNKAKQLGAQITLPGLAAAQLHPAILQYLSAEIDYLIYEDRLNLLRNSSFDYSGDEINRYFLLINEEIKKKKKLAFDYVDQLILQAASFTVNYLVQPSWSLTKLIFDKEENIPVSKARQIINYVYYYEYIKEITEKYFHKKNVVNVNKTEFESLLQKIDSEVFIKYSEKLLDKVLDSMSDFFNIGSIQKIMIPLNAVELFLKEKRMEQYIQRLSDAFYPEPKYNYDITEIRKVLYSAVPVKKAHYMDRVLKQNVPDTFFKSPAQHEEANAVPEDIELQTFPEESKTTIDDLFETQEETKEESSPEAGAGIQQTGKEESHIVEQDDIKEEIHSHNPTYEEPVNFSSDKEDPGNLDFVQTVNDEAASEIPDTDQNSEVQDDSLERMDSILQNTEESSEKAENTIPEKDTSTSENDTIYLDRNELFSEPQKAADTGDEIINPGSAEISDEETVHSQSNKSEEEKSSERSDQREDFIEKPLTPWSLKKEKHDISSFISGKDINRIITNVFNDDTGDFALTFERIAECRTEDQAETILDGVLKSNGVKPSSKEALLLRKIINDYFNQ